MYNMHTHTHTLKWKVRKVTSLACKYRVLSAPRMASHLASPPLGCWGWTCRTACRSGQGAHSRCHTTRLCWKSQLSGKNPQKQQRLKCLSAARRWWRTERWHSFQLSSVFNHSHPVLLVATYTYFAVIEVVVLELLWSTLTPTWFHSSRCYLCTWEIPNELHSVLQRFPQCCLWNWSNVGLIDNDPSWSFQGRSSHTSSLYAALIQLTAAVMSLASSPYVMSQAPQHFRAPKTCTIVMVAATAYHYDVDWWFQMYEKSQKVPLRCRRWFEMYEMSPKVPVFVSGLWLWLCEPVWPSDKVLGW